MSHPSYIGANDLKTIAQHLINGGQAGVVDPDQILIRDGGQYLAHKVLVVSGHDVSLAWRVGTDLYLHIDRLKEMPNAVELKPLLSEPLLGGTCELYRYPSGLPFFMWNGHLIDGKEQMGHLIYEELLSRLPTEES